MNTDPLSVLEDAQDARNAGTGEGGQQQCDLRLTTSGIRQCLCRKARQRPLLRLVCKGCGLSTHDPDIFIPEDYLECPC